MSQNLSQEEVWKLKAVDTLLAFEEQGFFVEKVSEDTFVITDDINRRYLKVTDPKFEEKFWQAYTEIFTRVEKECNLKDDYDVYSGVDGINIFYPNFLAIDHVEKEKYRFTESGIKCRRKGEFVEAVIPYTLFIEWLYELLEL